MRKSTKILGYFILTVFSLQSQTNLVQNPSFEMNDTCPTTIGQVNYAINWHILYNSPDYFNACASYPASVPSNFFDYQNPSSGNAYAGFWAYTTTATNYREIIGAQLGLPLVIGQKYYIRLSLNLALGYNSNSGSDKAGLRFTNTPHTISNPPSINNLAHIYSTNIITDTLNWTVISGSFIADSSYGYIEIGNFFDDAHTNIQTLRFQTANESYLFVDDLCISTDSMFTMYIKKENQNKIKPYPNPSSNGYFYSNVNFSNDEINVYDLLGNHIKKLYVNGNLIDLSDLDNGIYFIEMNNKQYQLKEKIIIKK